MNISPTLQQVEGFIVTGFSVRTQNKDEFNEKTAKLPTLWQQFYNSELASNTKTFGVYSNYDSDANGYYTVTAGIKLNRAQTGLNEMAIKTGNYLVFEGKGLMPGAVVEAWQRVWNFFETNKEYQRNYISDFEAYISASQVEIYIGVQ